VLDLDLGREGDDLGLDHLATNVAVAGGLVVIRDRIERGGLRLDDLSNIADEAHRGVVLGEDVEGVKSIGSINVYMSD
jgi:hypothetical protein